MFTLRDLDPEAGICHLDPLSIPGGLPEVVIWHLTCGLQRRCQASRSD